MKKNSILTLVLSVFLIIIMLVGCGVKETGTEVESHPVEGAVSSETIKIGIWEPLTGNLAAGGSQKMEGYELANEQRPTVLGKKVELVVVDNKSDKLEATNSMSRLIEKEKVTAVLGTYGSSLAIAGIGISEREHIPVIPCASSPLVTEGKKYVTRTSYQDPFAGTVMAKYAALTLKAKTVAIIQDVSQDYSIGLANYFREEFLELTGDPNSIIAVVSYNSGDQDFTAQLNYVKSMNPDAIFAPGYYGDGALLAIQAKEMGIDIPLLGGDGWEAPELFEIGGDAVEGLVFGSNFARDAAKTDKTKNFIKDYETKYGSQVNALSAIAFDNYNLLLDCIEQVGSPDSEAINTALRSTKDWEGVNGNITIDENGNPIKPSPIIEVKNGKFQYIMTVEP